MPNWSPTRAVFARCLAGNRPDPALERLLRGWLAVGLLAVLLVPALRGSSAWLGWWPLWLVAMPGMAWWALHRFRMPQLPGSPARIRRSRRAGGQARRRAPAAAAGIRRAA